jgi:hypothetical protein
MLRHALGDADDDTENDDNDANTADKSNPYMSPFSRRHKKGINLQKWVKDRNGWVAFVYQIS